MNNYKNNSILEIRNKVRQRSDFVHFEQYMKNNTVFQENCSRVIDIFIQFTDCEHLVSKHTFTKKEFDNILHDHISCFIYIHPWIVIMSDNNNNNNNNNKFDKFDTFKQYIINCPAIIMMNIKTTMPYIKKKTTVSSLDEQYKLLKLHIEKSTLLFYQFFVILASTFNNDIYLFQTYVQQKHDQEFIKFMSIIDKDFMKLCLLSAELLVDFADCEHLIIREKITNNLLHNDVYRSLFDHFMRFVYIQPNVVMSIDDICGTNYNKFKECLMGFVPAHLKMI